MADENQQYSEQNFWNKIKSAAVFAGREVVEKALTLFYAAQRPETPLWAKMTIYSALTYLILPADAIPDFLPISGYVDDLGTLAAALGAVAIAITPEIRKQASQQAREWFKEESQPQSTPSANDTIREIAID